jgi:hypothetical protein
MGITKFCFDQNELSKSRTFPRSEQTLVISVALIKESLIRYRSFHAFFFTIVKHCEDLSFLQFVTPVQSEIFIFRSRQQSKKAGKWVLIMKYWNIKVREGNKRRKRGCIDRESNPDHSRGRRAFYHWTIDASLGRQISKVKVHIMRCISILQKKMVDLEVKFLFDWPQRGACRGQECFSFS